MISITVSNTDFKYLLTFNHIVIIYGVNHLLNNFYPLSQRKPFLFWDNEYDMLIHYINFIIMVWNSIKNFPVGSFRMLFEHGKIQNAYTLIRIKKCNVKYIWFIIGVLV